ncbi:MAG: extracellular solute-binding protein [Cyanobacteriota bacterium]|nr:extracellular solute-binding protein [Cyanobacteriota bacterium]
MTLETPAPRPIFRVPSPWRFFSLAACLLALLALAGCGRGPSLNADASTGGTLQIMLGISSDEQLSEALVQEQVELISWIEWCFEQLYPDVRLVLTQYREKDIPAELAQRDRDGMAPDLLLVNASTATALWRSGLTKPLPANSPVAAQLRRSVRQRVSTDSQSLIGVPVLITPQLACFNRKRLPASPASLPSLIDSSDKGIDVGMSIAPQDVYWTTGAMGANPAMERVLWGEALGPADRQALLRWLSWLQDVTLHERVNFYDNQEQLVQALIRGQLDWITCSSTSLVRLRRVLGDRLGVAALPGGPAGQATPLLNHRMWIFGRNSSPVQQRIAEALVRFSLSPPMQRYLTIKTEAMLPVTGVSIPTGGRPMLEAMMQAKRQARATRAIGEQIRVGDPRLESIRKLLLRLSYQEISSEQSRSPLY